MGVTAGWVSAALCLISVVAGLVPATTEASRQRTFTPTPGVVRAPIVDFAAHAHGHTHTQASASQYAGRAPEVHGTPSAVDFTDTRVALRRAVAYQTTSGDSVWVSVSRRYEEDRRADRVLVAYIDSLLHGEEIEGLRLMVLRADEISNKCGVGVAACYFPGTDTIVVVGEDRFGGLPTDYVLAHEYGHRIAHYSANPPFRGGAFWHGPKRWATQEKVCEKLRKGRLSISRSAYWNFPGENFAEAYAQYHIRGQVRWQYSPALRPTGRSFAAIERDVTSPWKGPHVRDIRRWLPPNSFDRFIVRTPLDGRFTADLYGLDGGRFSFEMGRPGRVIARASGPVADFRLSRMICGQRVVYLKVRAGKRGGSYRLIIDRP